MAAPDINDLRRWRKRLLFFLALALFSVLALLLWNGDKRPAFWLNDVPALIEGGETVCSGQADDSLPSSAAAGEQAGQGGGLFAHTSTPAVSSPGFAELEQERKKQAAPLIPICVSGAVRFPGVYHLPDDAYYLQAIEKAGGFSEGAAIAYLNLAEALRAHEMIYVPTLEEWRDQKLPSPLASGNPGGSDSATVQLKISLNRATAEELARIPGVGEKTAAQIIRFRETQGAFAAIEDIMKVPGIKEAKFEQMRAYIQP